MIATRVGDVSTIVLPKKKRYWNYYALQMRSVVNSVKTGIHISTVTGSGKGARTSSVPVKASIVYDNLATGKPEEIDQVAWDACSSIWYDALTVGCPLTHKHIYTGVRIGDGVGMLKALRRHIGSKQVQKDRFDKDMAAHVVKLQNPKSYFWWYGELNEIFFQYNVIPDLAEAEKWDDSYLRTKYVSGIAKCFR